MIPINKLKMNLNLFKDDKLFQYSVILYNFNFDYTASKYLKDLKDLNISIDESIKFFGVLYQENEIIFTLNISKDL